MATETPVQIVNQEICCPWCAGDLQMRGIGEGECGKGHPIYAVLFMCSDCKEPAALDFHPTREDAATQIRWTKPTVIAPGLLSAKVPGSDETSEVN